MLAIGLAQSVDAAPVVRALIVGINLYSDPKVTLKGAVNDAHAMRDRLAAAPFAVGLAAFPGGGKCHAENDTSRVLIDRCAKRADILAAFDALAAQSKPGDTLLFYFAGHGAQAATGTGDARTKALAMTSTIVASDSRKAVEGGVIDDIRGPTLNRHIVAAQAAGITVVTIFDSCNAGTATRNLDTSVTRSIDDAPLNAVADDPDPPRLPAAATPGGRIHLAAAADGTKAVERAADPKSAKPEDRVVHGRFTSTLIEVIGSEPNATYGDIVRDVRARIARTAADQRPQGEGDLTDTTFLGQPGDHDARTFAGTAEGGQVRIAGDGTLSGLTIGSTYALYATEAAALGETGLLGIATVRQVTPQSALLEVAGTPGLPHDVIAREAMHSFGDLVLPVGFSGVPEPEIAAAIKDLPLVRRDDRNPELVVSRSKGVTLLLSAQQEQIATIDRIQAPSDAERIGVALRRAANAKALQSLPEKPTDARLGQIKFFDRCGDCKTSAASDLAAPSLTKGDRVRLLIKNLSTANAYPYLFAISPQLAITRLYPPGGASDELKPRGDFFVGDTVTAAAVGTTRLVLIMSAVPIPAGPLEQGGLPRAGCDSGSALTMLLCAAASGTRAVGAVPSGDFDVVKLVLTIRDGDGK
jgi:hypothetical protein